MTVQKTPRPPLIHPEPSEEDIARGQRFAAWLDGALRAKGWNMKRLADASGVTPTNIGIYMDDCKDPQTGRIRRPKPVTVRKLAAALEADVTAALNAAGYFGETEEERVVIAPGRAVRILTWENDKQTHVDTVLTRDAIDLILAHEAIRKARSGSGSSGN